MEEIECILCKEKYPCYKGNFSKQLSNKTGFTKECVKCRQIYYREYRERNVEKRKVYYNNYYNSIKEARRKAGVYRESKYDKIDNPKDHSKFKRSLEIAGNLHNKLYCSVLPVKMLDSWKDSKERKSLFNSGLMYDEEKEILSNQIMYK